MSDDVGFKKVWNKVRQGGLNSEENYNHYKMNKKLLEIIFDSIAKKM